MAKRDDIDQPEAQRGGQDREMNDTRDDNTANRAEDVRGIADAEEEEDFEEDDAEDLEEEDIDET